MTNIKRVREIVEELRELGVPKKILNELLEWCNVYDAKQDECFGYYDDGSKECESCEVSDNCFKRGVI